ncbi:type 1 glutamine amidotransferase domain-containing protein [Echinicola sp. 20G]|uniref:type 1 glutamine amidotransferase domain-containing protein n=1 Tax=Echinicola sp. 20G TaxID=2781961 RepID=UPI0019106168|nr:type 1 glutamine amidotransferase domain-containing protein [Echinicola sp. 20G]
MENLQNKRVAILATNGFEESELTSPKQALEDSGAKVDVVSIETGSIKGWKNGNWSNSVRVDKTLEEVYEEDYDALVLPGGVINPDQLRRSEKAIQFVRAFFKNHKPVAAICHGPQVLVEADVVNGRKLTSFHSIKTDLMNAGAKWFDEAVVVDHGLVTSRTPDDLPDFNRKLVEEVREGTHSRQMV